jgi:hypothetical protein
MQRPWEKATMIMEEETGVMWLPDHECPGLPETPEAGSEIWNRSFPGALGEGTGPAHTLIPTSGLLSIKRMSFYCFNPPHVWHFVMAATGSQYTGNRDFAAD